MGKKSRGADQRFTGLEKKGHRLLQLAERLNRGEEICVGEVAREWGVSPRTVRRHLNEIEEFFGVKLDKVRRGCYIHPSPEILSKILLQERNDGKLLLQLIALLHPKLITDFFSISAEVVERFQKEWGTLRILQSPAEDISEQQWAHLQEFQKGLTRKVLIDIDYRRMEGGEEITFNRVHPLRILVAEGNWYLAIYTPKEEPVVKFLRLASVQGIVLRNTESHVPREVQEFIDRRDLTIFSKFGVPIEKVIVEVDREVASYFIAKKFHPTQRILDADLNNGGMLIEFQVTNPREITFLAKKWLPHIQILRPTSIRQEFEKMVRQYLSKMDNI